MVDVTLELSSRGLGEPLTRAFEPTLLRIGHVGPSPGVPSHDLPLEACLLSATFGSPRKGNLKQGLHVRLPATNVPRIAPL